MIVVTVCDDERPFLRMMKKYIEAYFAQRNVEYAVECYTSGKELISRSTMGSRIDIVFLDINMDEMDGIEVAKEIRKYSSEVFIVFVTAYVKYSLEGYKVDAVRYILKNSDGLEESIEECLNTIIKKMNYSIPVRHFIFNECEKDINIEHIMYIESNLHKLEFHILEGTIKSYTMYETLNNIEQELSNNLFVRIHQSQLVNLKYITELKEHSEKMQGARTVVLSGGEELIVPKARFKTVKRAFVAYKGEF